jgi:peptidoglycan-N-acetylglucosamine deacetylase
MEDRSSLKTSGEAPVKLNMLSFDIEGLVESSQDVLQIPEKYLGKDEEAMQIEVNTHRILEFLAERNQKATFFVLGRISRDMPQLVRDIANAGHEVACHSFYHRRLFTLDDSEVRSFVADAKHSLEDVSGQAVYGFRAPDFSIVSRNRWVFDALREAGYIYDSSVYPTSVHDVYGIGGFSRKPCRLANGLIEVPMSVIALFSQQVPFGGGGYLRLYPRLLTEWFFHRLNRGGIPGMVYLHPYEVGDLATYIAEMSWIRRIRTYQGRRTVRKKLAALIDSFDFVPIKEYLDTSYVREIG